MLRTRLFLGVAALFAFALAVPARAIAQGVTTGAITGTVSDEAGRTLPGVQVQLRNSTTGLTVNATTRANGQYQIQGLQPDANYVLTVRRIGFAPVTRQPVRITLGQTTREDVTLAEQATVLEAVKVSGTIDPVINATKAGTGTTVSDSALSRLPTLNRNFSDFVSLVPQVQTNTVGLSGGGVNIRQNAIQIDGAQAGDLFGLGTSGQPGAQANAKSIPLDAVKEYQVLLSPFDIRQGNFGGLLINAVTKSGTNDFHGSVYGYTRDQKLTRSQEYLGDYTQQQYGLSVGGPLVKDKLFFFVNPEWQRLTQPASGPYTGSTNPAPTVSEQTIAQFNQIASGFGLPDLGNGGKITRDNPLTNVFARVDAYLPWNTRLVLRHNYAKADNVSFGRSLPTSTTPSFGLTSNAYKFSSETNSSVAELLSTLPNGIFNELLVNRTTIRDFRTVPVTTPQIEVQNVARADTNLANARIFAGTEASSQGNSLDQNIFELTNNLTIPIRSHSFTIGAKGIFYKPTNLFAQNRYGTWRFNSMADFQAGRASNYVISAPAPTDKANGLATFRANNYSVYAQDQWTVTPTLTLTAGVRWDKPDFKDAPPENEPVFTEYNRHTSSVPSKANISPRFSFNWDVTGDGMNQLRGGFGYFSGSVPFVYLSNAFGNSGLSGFSSLTCNGSTSGTFSQAVPAFNADAVANPPLQCAPSGTKAGAQLTGPSSSAAVNTIDPDFRFPQYQKATLGYDRRLGWGLVGTIEGLLTRSVNNVFYQNLALVGKQGTDAHGRVMYGTLSTSRANPVFQGSRTSVLDATNSSGDYIGSITAQLQKSFADRWEGSFAYTYQTARDVTTTTSSTAGSNYRYQRSVKGDILEKNRTRSKNDQPHRIIATATYNFPTKTDVSVVYQGNSGAPYDYVYGSSGSFGDLNADGQTQNDLLYVPTDVNDPNQIQFRANGSVTAAQQAAAFDQLINRLDCLKDARGTIMDRNSCRNPWANQFDVSLAQSLSTFGFGNAQVRLDVINFGNLLNKRWGRQAFSDQGSTCGNLCGSTLLLTHVGNAVPAGTPANGTLTAVPIVQFNPNFTPFDATNAASNYRMQLSLRYSF
jgi:outer membrane receptor protein involved in Fe transport